MVANLANAKAAPKKQVPVAKKKSVAVDAKPASAVVKSGNLDAPPMTASQAIAATEAKKVGGGAKKAKKTSAQPAPSFLEMATLAGCSAEVNALRAAHTQHGYKLSLLEVAARAGSGEAPTTIDAVRPSAATAYGEEKRRDEAAAATTTVEETVGDVRPAGPLGRTGAAFKKEMGVTPEDVVKTGGDNLNKKFGIKTGADDADTMATLKEIALKKAFGDVLDKNTGEFTPILTKETTDAIAKRKDQATTTLGECAGVLHGKFANVKGNADARLAEHKTKLHVELKTYIAEEDEKRDAVISKGQTAVKEAAATMAEATARDVASEKAQRAADKTLGAAKAAYERGSVAQTAKVGAAKTAGEAAVARVTKRADKVFGKKIAAIPSLRAEELKEAHEDCAKHRVAIAADGKMIGDLVSATRRVIPGYKPPPLLQVGDLVDARDAETGKWYAATVTAANEEDARTYDLLFSDGSAKKGVKAKFVRAQTKCKGPHGKRLSAVKKGTQVFIMCGGESTPAFVTRVRNLLGMCSYDITMAGLSTSTAKCAKNVVKARTSGAVLQLTPHLKHAALKTRSAAKMEKDAEKLVIKAKKLAEREAKAEEEAEKATSPEAEKAANFKVQVAEKARESVEADVAKAETTAAVEAEKTGDVKTANALRDLTLPGYEGKLRPGEAKPVEAKPVEAKAEAAKAEAATPSQAQKTGAGLRFAKTSALRGKAKVGSLSNTQTQCIARHPTNEHKSAVSEMTGVNWLHGKGATFLAVAVCTGGPATNKGAHYSFFNDAAEKHCACTLTKGARCHYTTQADPGKGTHTSFCCQNSVAVQADGPEATNTKFTNDIAKICSCMIQQ
jgi:hypothetical protein